MPSVGTQSLKVVRIPQHYRFSIRIALLPLRIIAVIDLGKRLGQFSGDARIGHAYAGAAKRCMLLGCGFSQRIRPIRNDGNRNIVRMRALRIKKINHVDPSRY